MLERDSQQSTDIQISVGAPGTSVSLAGINKVSMSAPADKTDLMVVDFAIVYVSIFRLSDMRSSDCKLPWNNPLTMFIVWRITAKTVP